MQPHIHRQSESGFTFIEVMVVVAIIGMLAAFAVPKVMIFRFKAMQGEARAHLGTIARLESAYRAEHGFFTDNLCELGWTPEGAPRYLYGFASDNQPTSSGCNDAAELVASGHAHFPINKVVDFVGVPLIGSDLPAEATASAESFNLAAVGNLDLDETLDVWTVNADGVWTHLVDDTVD